MKSAVVVVRSLASSWNIVSWQREIFNWPRWTNSMSVVLKTLQPKVLKNLRGFSISKNEFQKAFFLLKTVKQSKLIQETTRSLKTTPRRRHSWGILQVLDLVKNYE